MNAADVSLVIPTRGNVDLTPILEASPFADTIVWDNSRREDRGIYSRYHAIRQAKNPVIATQDDDVLVECWDDLLYAYEPGVLVVNYPEPWDVPWVARGAVFDCDLPGRAFDRYLAAYPFDRLFTHHICDAVFGLLSETRVLDFGSSDLPHGFADGRVSTSPGWYDGARPEAQRRCEALKAAA